MRTFCIFHFFYQTKSKDKKHEKHSKMKPFLTLQKINLELKNLKES